LIHRQRGGNISTFNTPKRQPRTPRYKIYERILFAVAVNIKRQTESTSLQEKVEGPTLVVGRTLSIR
jgi:hypothetical protein